MGEREERIIPPYLRREVMSITVPKWLKVWIKEQEVPAGVLIERALVESYRLLPGSGRKGGGRG